MTTFLFSVVEMVRYFWLVLCEAGRLWWRQMLRFGFWSGLGIAVVGVLLTVLLGISSGTKQQLVIGVLSLLTFAVAFAVGDLFWAPVSIYKQQEEKINDARKSDRTEGEFRRYRDGLATLIKDGEEIKRRLHDSQSGYLQEWSKDFDEWDRRVRRFLDSPDGPGYLAWYEDKKVQPPWVTQRQGLKGDEEEDVREAWELVQTRIQGLHFIAMDAIH